MPTVRLRLLSTGAAALTALALMPAPARAQSGCGARLVVPGAQHQVAACLDDLTT
ncbi:MAG: tannase/feruloyl esterase family alpha/beta hydrolase, partial [Actinomadura rubrobrunea]|nr:tannase/feruloyl esterase family alpha/beta hydrolase [Actinomadura rubrobrunea]